MSLCVKWHREEGVSKWGISYQGVGTVVERERQAGLCPGGPC